MIRTLNYILPLLLLLLFSGRLPAQTEWEEQSGEIVDAEVVIEKDVNIVLPFAQRNFRKVPPPPAFTAPKDLNYSYQMFQPNLSPISPRLRVLRVESEPIAKLYSNFIKAGYGNFNAPYLEALFHSKRDQNFHYGAHLFHRSAGKGPVDGKNSANGTTKLHISGKQMNESNTLFGDLEYLRTRQFFYGYPQGLEVDRDSLEQIYNFIKGNIGVYGGNRQSKIYYDASIHYQFIKDQFKAREGQFGVNIISDLPFNEEFGVNLEGSVYLITREDENISSYTRGLIRISPSLKFSYNDIHIKAGFTAAWENDTLENLDKLHLYPNIKAQYKLSPKVLVLGGISGNIIKNTLADFARANPFLNSNISIFHSNNEIEFYGELKANLSNKIGANTGISFKSIENQAFFLNDPLDTKKFQVVYDTESNQVLTYYLSFDLQIPEKIQLNLRSDFFNYNTKIQQEAWHRPTYQVRLSGKINFYHKVHIYPDLTLMGGIKAFDSQTSSTVNLDDFADLGFTIDYMVSPRFSVFLSANNLFSEEYEQLLFYPVRGLQIQGGLSYGF